MKKNTKVKQTHDTIAKTLEFARIKNDAKRYLGEKEALARMEVDQVISNIFCGCGDSDAAQEAFCEVFRLFEDNENHILIQPIWESEFVKKHGEGLTTLILYWLNEFGLAEHGGSVGGSWLTPLGIVIKEEFLTRP